MPGSKLCFMHLHTNQVEELIEKNVLPDKNIRIKLTIQGKLRPMLLLWESDGIYRLLLMTSQEKNLFWGKRIKISDGSFVDCSRYYEYNEKLLEQDRKPKHIGKEKFNEVLGELPPLMADQIKDIWGNEMLRNPIKENETGSVAAIRKRTD